MRKSKIESPTQYDIDVKAEDTVNSPSHYNTANPILIESEDPDTGESEDIYYTPEAVDVIESFFLNDAHLSQAFKYMARASTHDEGYLENVRKARWWLNRAVEHDETYGERTS